jgi:hypothetical protein
MGDTITRRANMKRVKIRSGIKAGLITANHNQTGLRIRSAKKAARPVRELRAAELAQVAGGHSDGGEEAGR